MSTGTPEQQVVALLQRGDLRGAHQLLLAMLAQRPDDTALRARAQQVEALIQQRLQSGLPVGAPAPVAAPPPAPAHAPAAAGGYDPQTLAALQAQVMAEPVRYAYAYLQAGRLGESLQLLRLALAREPGNTQVRDLALYVARQIQQQQAQAAGGPPPAAPNYGGPAPAAPNYVGPAPAAPNYGGPAPAAPAFRPNYAGSLAAPAPLEPSAAPPVPRPRQSYSPPPAPAPSPRYPQDARVHRTGEMPAFMLDDSPALAAAAAMPPRVQLPPSAPAPVAPRYPLDARAGESQEMFVDELVPPARRSEPHQPSSPAPAVPPQLPSAPPPSLPVARSTPPGVPTRSHPAGPRREPAFAAPLPSTPAGQGGLSSTSAPPDEPRPEPNEIVRVAREMVRAAARLEAERKRPSMAVPRPSDLAIAMDEPVEAVPVDFDEVPEPEEEPPPALGQWPGPSWVDRSIPSATSPLARGLVSEPFERPVPSAHPPAPLRSQPPAAHRWDADFSSPERDAFQTDDEPMPAWNEPAPEPVREDPLVVEARARAERMTAAFDRYTQRDSAPAAPAAPAPVDYSAGLEAELVSASDAATEIAVPSDLHALEDEPLDLSADEPTADEPYDFEPVPLEAEALRSVPPAAEAVSIDEPFTFSENPPSEAQIALADPGADFVSAPSAPSSEEVAMLEALLGQIRERRRSPSRYLERV